MAAKGKSNPRPKRIQKPYRKYGFRSQEAYENWVKKWSSIPESDPRYFRRNLRGHARESEIARLKRTIKRTLSPSKEIRRKRQVLVDTLGKLSPFNFLDRYRDMMNALLRDPNTSDYDKRILRRMLKTLNEEISVGPNTDVEINEQLRLFR